MRKLIAFTLALTLGPFASASLAQTDSGASSINLAGEQRMLSQRVVKLYSQIGLNVLPGPATGQIAVASGQFENNLEALKAVVAGSEKATDAYKKLFDEWLKLKKAMSIAISRDAAEALARQSEATLAAAERLTSIIEDESKSVTNRIINLAGRQRMLSQRVAANYLLRSWGVESSAVRDNLDRSVKDFSAGLEKLLAHQENSDEIRLELEEVTQQWEWLRASLSVDGAGAYRLIVAESADGILEATNRITRLYEQQARR
jgi:nitrate/nitrite-specific signal transduction histidine kinase